MKKNRSKVVLDANPFLEKQKLHVFLIIFLSFAVNANTLFMGFVLDDNGLILNNTLIRSLKNIPAFFTTALFSGAVGQTLESLYYRPLFNLSLAIDYFFWDLTAFGYHLTNVLLHSFVAVLVYFLTQMLFKRRLASLAAGLLFGLHSIHSEAVAWISGRNEPLLAIMLISAFMMYIRFVERGEKRFLMVGMVVFGLALLSKETAVIFPLLILLYEICFIRDKLLTTIGRVILICLPLVPYLWFRFLVVRTIVPEAQTEQFLPRLYTSFEIVLNYLELLLFPGRTKLFFEVPIKTNFFDIGVILPILILGFLGFIAIYLWKKKRPEIAFTLGWILVPLIPVIGLFAKVPSSSVMATRYLYIPSIGFAFLCGIIFSDIHMSLVGKKKPLKRQSRIQPAMLLFGCGIAILGVNSFFSIDNNRSWADQLTYAQQRLKDSPHTAMSHIIVAEVMEQQGKLAEARDALVTADTLKPGDPQILNNLGMVHMKMGQVDEALTLFQKAVAIDQNYAISYNNLAILYLERGDISEAENILRKALAMNPDNHSIYFNLAVVVLQKKDFDEALNLIQKARSINPISVQYANTQANILLQRGLTRAAHKNLDGAIQDFTAVLKTDSDQTVEAYAYFNRGQAYRLQGNDRLAGFDLKKAVELGDETLKSKLSSVKH